MRKKYKQQKDPNSVFEALSRSADFTNELIPKDLLETIVSSRYLVPFPPIIEALFLEISIELLREAGSRLPAKSFNWLIKQSPMSSLKISNHMCLTESNQRKT